MQDNEAWSCNPFEEQTGPNEGRLADSPTSAVVSLADIDAKLEKFALNSVVNGRDFGHRSEHSALLLKAQFVASCLHTVAVAADNHCVIANNVPSKPTANATSVIFCCPLYVQLEQYQQAR